MVSRQAQSRSHPAAHTRDTIRWGATPELETSSRASRARIRVSVPMHACESAGAGAWDLHTAVQEVCALL
jgi:hypothetical protein